MILFKFDQLLNSIKKENRQKMKNYGFRIVNEKKKHLLKDDKANLVVLCASCHDKLHNNEFEIKGLTKTTKGVKAIIK